MMRPQARPAISSADGGDSGGGDGKRGRAARTLATICSRVRAGGRAAAGRGAEAGAGRASTTADAMSAKKRRWWRRRWQGSKNALHDLLHSGRNRGGWRGIRQSRAESRDEVLESRWWRWWRRRRQDGKDRGNHLRQSWRSGRRRGSSVSKTPEVSPTSVKSPQRTGKIDHVHPQCPEPRDGLNHGFDRGRHQQRRLGHGEPETGLCCHRVGEEGSSRRGGDGGGGGDGDVRWYLRLLLRRLQRCRACARTRAFVNVQDVCLSDSHRRYTILTGSG